jgi:transmembrane 9 superfamily protein 2/4
MQFVISYLLGLVMFLSVDITEGALYLPGVAPRGFKIDDNVDLLVSGLSSVHTQMPYDYYSLPYCKPAVLKQQSENIGEVLEGDIIEESVYEVSMRNPQSCAVACIKRLSGAERKQFRNAIKDDYYVHWIVDNLPVGQRLVDKAGTSTSGYTFVRGFPVGFMESFTTKNGKLNKKAYLNNHIRIILSFWVDETGDDANRFFDVESIDEDLALITGFRVEPMSIKHDWSGDEHHPTFNTCNSLTPPKNDPALYLALDDLGSQEQIAFTYDVVWEKTATMWSQRWDVYLDADSPNDQVHWFSISNSILVVLLMAIMIAIILVRALYKDIASYNDRLNGDEAKEESGWKLVHGDVFRPPKNNAMGLSVLVGTGCQLIGMVYATLSFALMGLLSPANRGALVSAFIILYVLMGATAGYASAVVYKMFRGVEWKKNTFLTAMTFPTVMGSIFTAINLILYEEGSSGALPAGTFFTLMFLWFCVSVPLVCMGAYFGYRKETMTHPVRTNQIPRQIPPQEWYMSQEICILIAGILPFGAVTVELYFIMTALWLHHIYYIFGFLCLVLMVLVVTTAEVSILINYFQLCSEDYRWWWRSFLTGGSCAFYMMLYAVWYNLTELELSGVPALLVYYGYMALMSVTVFIITGTIGFFSCLFFNHYIYSSLKVD